MKKPLVIFALLGALIGCAILGTCFYYEWAFGNGNFNQVVYITEVDPITKTVDRNWADVSTAERTGPTFVNMWALGAIFLLSGPAILALDHSFRDNKHF